MSGAPPRVLLIGAGRFGSHHLTNWLGLQEAGEAAVHGVVVRSEASRTRLAAQHAIPVHTELTDDLLRAVDAVDIVTPPETHDAIVRRCLRFAHVLVEKPLTLSAASSHELGLVAREAGRVLMVGHIYRYHPVVRRLQEIVRIMGDAPRGIEGVMLNPPDDQARRADAAMEFMHLFDIIDLLFGVEPQTCLGVDRGGARHVSLRYPGPINASLTLGWRGAEKLRRLRLIYTDRDIDCDLVDNSIVISRRNNQVDKIFCGHDQVALRDEFRSFLAAIAKPHAPAAEADYPDAAVAARIAGVSERAAPRIRSASDPRPRVAVIGAGVFGATAAHELAGFCDVTVFERHPEIMTEVSFVNQWRHHSGFHYPRSYDQIQEIRAARDEFEREFRDAILTQHPAYFCTSATGVEIPADRYLAACTSNGLRFTIESPPETILDHSRISLALKSDEGVYDFFRMQRIMRDRLTTNTAIRLRLREEVVGGTLEPDGVKRLTVRGPGGVAHHDFDFVINATYANRNLLAKWFRFPIEPVRFDLYEMLVLRLPIDPICVTIMDGPFTSLVTMGYDNLFMLSHIHDSVLKSVITDDGLPPRWSDVQSNRQNMIRHSSRYLPILREAEFVESRLATRTVNAFAKDFDARPTVVTAHGFGCWSILGGKIITCVHDTRQIAASIRAECGIPADQVLPPR